MIADSFSQNQGSGGHIQGSGSRDQAPAQVNGFNGTHEKGNMQPGVGRSYGGNVPADVNVLHVLASYMGILAIFTIITYYIGSWLHKNKRYAPGI